MSLLSLNKVEASYGPSQALFGVSLDLAVFTMYIVARQGGN